MGTYIRGYIHPIFLHKYIYTCKNTVMLTHTFKLTFKLISTHSCLHIHAHTYIYTF